MCWKFIPVEQQLLQHSIRTLSQLDHWKNQATERVQHFGFFFLFLRFFVTLFHSAFLTVVSDNMSNNISLGKKV